METEPARFSRAGLLFRLQPGQIHQWAIILCIAAPPGGSNEKAKGMNAR